MTTQAFTDTTGINPGTTYYYTVVGVNQYGEGAHSTQVGVYANNIPPPIPPNPQPPIVPPIDNSGVFI